MVSDITYRMHDHIVKQNSLESAIARYGEVDEILCYCQAHLDVRERLPHLKTVLYTDRLYRSLNGNLRPKGDCERDSPIRSLVVLAAQM